MVEIYTAAKNCDVGVIDCHVSQGYEIFITKEYLQSHLSNIFVFGDNVIRRGTKGAAILRHEPNTYGFVTKALPNNRKESFFTVDDYAKIYKREIRMLRNTTSMNLTQIFLISKLGAGLANRNHIFEKVIEPNIKADLADLENVVFLW